MKVLELHDIRPIHLYPGDSIRCTWTPPYRDLGDGWKPEDVVLATHCFEEPRTVDRVAIVELDGELAALGMSQGIAGVFGKRV